MDFPAAAVAVQPWSFIDRPPRPDCWERFPMHEVPNSGAEALSLTFEARSLARGA